MPTQRFIEPDPFRPVAERSTSLISPGLLPVWTLGSALVSGLCLPTLQQQNEEIPSVKNYCMILSLKRVKKVSEKMSIASAPVVVAGR